MNPEDYEGAFKLISVAGNAKSSSMMAIREAREGNLEEKKLLEEADKDLREAHGSQDQDAHPGGARQRRPQSTSSWCTPRTI